MCFGPKNPKDNSAEIVREQETERAAKVKSGQKAIDDTFGGTFTPEYYDKRTQDYLGYYNPQIQEQYDQALKDLTFNLARGGNAESSVSSEKFGKLAKARSDAATKVANDALASSGELKSRVEQQKGSLYTLNNSAADPTQAASQAAAALAGLNTPTSYSPLGSLFSSLIQTGGNQAAINTAVSGNPFNGPTAASTSATGSGLIVKR